MNAKIEVRGRAVQSFKVPENADEAFTVCLEGGMAKLDLARVLESDDPIYGRVLEMEGEIELLAEARPIVEAIKQGLRRRRDNPVEEGEEIRFR